MADTDYTIPAPSSTIDTSGTIGALTPTAQLPISANGLHEYPTATKTYQASLMDPNKTHTVFKRNIITTELPAADGTGAGNERWTNATASISYTDEGYGEEV